MNDTLVGPVQQMDALSRFRHAVATAPDRTAVAAVDGRLSFTELEDRTARLANALRASGVGRGERVGVCLPRTTQLVVALLGIWRAGAAYVPLDPAYTASRLAFMATDARLALVLGAGAEASWAPGVEVLGLGDLLAADGPGPDRMGEVALTSQDSAYVIYTSGSTGTPKGVEVSHRGVAALLAALESAGVYRSEPGVVAWNASASFDASVQQWVRVCRGDTIWVLDEGIRSDPVRLVRMLRQHGVTDMDLTPSHWELLREQFLGDEPRGGVAPRLFMGGEPVPERTWEEIGAAGIDAVNLYGPTECTVDSTVARIAGPRPHLGGPVPGMRVYVLDEALRPVTDGGTGELYIAGPQVANGYLSRPSLTAERFVADMHGRPGERMYRTGDRGRLGDGGVIEYAGRTDRQVKLRGFRMELGEIENALARCAGVAAAAVIMHNDQRLRGYVTGLAGPLKVAPILDELSGMLPVHMIPATVTVLDELPVTTNGKLDYHALSRLSSAASPAAGAAAPAAGAAAPAVTVAERVARAWCEVLGLDSVEPADDFLRLGGHSLSALRVVHMLRRELSVELQLRDLLDARDLAAFTQTVRRAAHTAAPRPALVSRPAGVS
jgi:amino acid adenylation domain-containing protein